MEKLNGESFDIIEDNINKLKELFPEIVNGDNQVDFEALKDLFEKNNYEIVDDNEEHYKFTWWGKKKAKQLAHEKTTKTLRPIKKDSKNWDTTENIYIEGDNLEAMKILLGSYRNKVKMIYIDPPYNTGGDLVYHDKFSETEDKYLKETNQLTDKGYLKENKKTKGKYHSNWLNMMYPRLKLARNLLKEDGVIFISIDDNEVENLKKICNEIFDPNNYVGTIIWRKKRGHGRGNSHYILQTEYILTYAKSIEKLPLFQKRLSEYKLKDYKFKDNLGKYKRETLEHHSPKGAYERKTLQYPIFIEGEEVYCTTGQWLWDKNHVEEELNNYIDETKTELKYLDIVRTEDNKLRLYKKIRLTDENGKMRSETPLTIIDESNISTNSSAFEIKNLFNEKVFDFSKPTELIRRLIEIGTIEKKDIIMDFFSGSGSTADAMFQLNNELNYAHKFLLIQLPELTYKLNNEGQKIPLVKQSKKAFEEGYENICEIGKERIRRAGDKILEKSDNEDLDIGFKVFKVDESNFIPWNSALNRDNIHQQLENQKNIIHKGSKIGLIYELILKNNFDLNVPIEEIETGNDKKNIVYVINNGSLLICLDYELSTSIKDDLINLKDKLEANETKVILMSCALTDESAINIYNEFKIKNIEFLMI